MAITNNYFKVMYEGNDTKEWDRKYAEWLDKRYLTKGQKVLELGCGRGEVIKRLNELGYIAEGCDYPEVNLEKPIPFNSNEYDVIICKNVIEHLRDIFTITKEIYRVLKVGGIAIIQTGDSSRDLVGWLQDPTHTTMFTQRRLKNLFLMTNFKLIKIKSFRNIPYIWRWTTRAFDFTWYPTAIFMGVFQK